jgi:hypothetical protein
MARLGLDRETSTPAELAARIKAETAQLAVVIKDAVSGENNSWMSSKARSSS